MPDEITIATGAAVIVLLMAVAAGAALGMFVFSIFTVAEDRDV